MEAQRGRRSPLVRNLEAPDHFELFIVSAVSAILAIRLFLHLVGYPRIGGERLHVAHMLWGGLLMLVALIALLSFLGKGSERFAAVVGGLGFGTFIDEIGKFVTRDNDYFFQPAVALMYITFVLLFLGFHGLHTRGEIDVTEYLLNALRELEELARHNLDPIEKRRTLDYLRSSDPEHPLVAPLITTLEGVEPQRPPAAGIAGRARSWLRATYRWVTRLPGFEKGMVVFFVGQLAVKLVYGAGLLLGAGVADRLVLLSWPEAAQLGASALSGVFVLYGVVRMRAARLAAYRWFERAMLVSILLVQPFSFYLDQFGALVQLIFNLTILAALRYMIHEERLRRT